MARSVWPKVALGAALLSLAGCGWLERAERPAWRAQAENYCLARDLVKPSAYYRAATGDRRTRHLRPHPPVQGLGAGRGDGRGRQERDDRLPADRRARKLARRGRPALRPGATSARTSSSSRRSAPIPAAASTTCMARRCRSIRSATRSTSPASASPTVARSSIVRDWKKTDTPGGGVPARGPRRRLPALHHRARARAPTSSTTTISISTWRCTARPRPARAAIAGRTRRPTCSRRPAGPTACRRRPISTSRWTSPAPACGRTPARSTCTAPRRRSRRRSPSRSSPRRRRCCRRDDVDGSPTSAIPLSSDD